MWAKIIANNLQWACVQLLGTTRGNQVYPIVKGILDVANTLDFRDVLNNVIDALEKSVKVNISIPKL